MPPVFRYPGAEEGTTRSSATVLSDLGRNSQSQNTFWYSRKGTDVRETDIIFTGVHSHRAHRHIFWLNMSSIGDFNLAVNELKDIASRAFCVINPCVVFGSGDPTAQISKEKRQSIITLRHECQSVRNISRTLKVSSKTIKLYDETGSHEDFHRQERQTQS